MTSATPEVIEQASPFDPLQRAAVRLHPDEIEWRVGPTWDREGVKWGSLLGYIDARTCMTKLDALWPEWQADYESHLNTVGTAEAPIVVGHVICRITLAGVTRADVGTPSNMEGAKGAFSDALKRAAVHFGIGRELYELPSIAVQVEVKANGRVGKPLALPTLDPGGNWTIDSRLGYVRANPSQAVATNGSTAPATTPAAPQAAAIGTQPADTAAFGLCPVHNKPFVDGRYGPYCQTKVGDKPDGKPLWCDQKPLPAGQTAAPRPVAAPANDEGMVDFEDVPF